MGDRDLADIADECIHLMTTAFCSICKAQTKAGERRKRATRRRNEGAWNVEEPLPYPNTTASHPGLCPACDEGFEEGTQIYLVDGGWLDYECAVDAMTMGEGISTIEDGGGHPSGW